MLGGCGLDALRGASLAEQERLFIVLPVGRLRHPPKPSFRKRLMLNTVPYFMTNCTICVLLEILLTILL